MASLDDLIVANKRFYRCPKSTGSRKVLTFLVSNDTYVTGLTMKFAKACAEAAGAETIVIPNVIRSPSVVKLIKSYSPKRITNILLVMLNTLLLSLSCIDCCCGDFSQSTIDLFPGIRYCF